MKLFCLLLIYTTFNCYSQNAISLRIGSDIDKYERQYFGLFPFVKYFESATTSLNSDSSFSIKITKSNGKNLTSDTTFTISKKLANNLAVYIDNFELCRNKERVPNWKVLEGQAIWTPILEYPLNIGNNIIIRTNKYEQFEGKLIYATDSKLYILQNTNIYNWKKTNEQITTIHFSDIKKIDIERKDNFSNGLTYGTIIGAISPVLIFASSGELKSDYSAYILPVTALFFGVVGGAIGGAVGALMDIDSEYNIDGKPSNYIEVLSGLKDDSIFPQFPPPEIQKMIEK